MELRITGTWPEIKKELQSLLNGTSLPEWSPPDEPAAPGSDVDIKGLGENAVTTNTEPPPGTVHVDSAGNPWNEIIHSGNKTFIKDGTWKLKRGVTPEEIGLAKNTGAIKPETGTPATLEEITVFVKKIVQSKRGNYTDITAHLTALGTPNLTTIPETELPAIAESLKLKFGVDF